MRNHHKYKIPQGLPPDVVSDMKRCIDIMEEYGGRGKIMADFCPKPKKISNTKDSYWNTIDKALFNKFAVSIPKELVLYYSNKHGLKMLWVYTLNVFALAGRGFAKKEEYIKELQKLGNVSQATAYRWLAFLLNEGCIWEKDGIIYQIGKKAYALKLGLNPKMQFRFGYSHIHKYTNFARACIIIAGVNRQNDFKYHIKRIYKNKECHVKSSQIQYPVSIDPKKVGCAQNHLVKRMGLSKGTINKALEGHLTHNYELVKWISVGELRFMIQQEVFKKSPRLRFGFSSKNKGKVALYYQLPSTIHFKPTTHSKVKSAEDKTNKVKSFQVKEYNGNGTAYVDYIILR